MLDYILPTLLGASVAALVFIIADNMKFSIIIRLPKPIMAALGFIINVAFFSIVILLILKVFYEVGKLVLAILLRLL